jgi:hypothetical protein
MTILIYGEKRVGKDTTADLIEDYFKNNNINYERYSFAKLPKEIFCKLKNISINEFENNKEKYRNELIWFAEEIKKVYPDFWVKAVIKKLDVRKINIISDLRFKIEYEKIKEVDNILILHIIDKNIKEQNIDKIEFENEIIIDNTKKDIKYLKNKVEKIIKENIC